MVPTAVSLWRSSVVVRSNDSEAIEVADGLSEGLDEMLWLAIKYRS
jgi:hypothetical protein